MIANQLNRQDAKGRREDKELVFSGGLGVCATNSLCAYYFFFGFGACSRAWSSASNILTLAWYTASTCLMCACSACRNCSICFASIDLGFERRPQRLIQGADP